MADRDTNYIYVCAYMYVHHMACTKQSKYRVSQVLLPLQARDLC